MNPPCHNDNPRGNLQEERQHEKHLDGGKLCVIDDGLRNGRA
jgi:hypothetical protein